MSSLSNTVEDFLDEDAEIPGQKFVLLSFLSPESVLENKDRFFFKRFVQSYEVDWKIKNIEKFFTDTVLSINRELEQSAVTFEKDNQSAVAELCRKKQLNVETIIDTYKEYLKKQQTDITKTTIEEAWDNFVFKERVKLEDEFHTSNDFRTTVRGLKIRGTYSNAKEAEGRAKKLQSKDKYHNILLGEVGKWLPWDPNPQNITEQEYSEERLNTLMKKYKENEDTKEKFFEDRKNTMSAKPESGKQTVGAVAKSVIERVSESSDIVNVTVEQPSEYTSMFNSSGDLAIERKREQ